MPGPKIASFAASWLAPIQALTDEHPSTGAVPQHYLVRRGPGNTSPYQVRPVEPSSSSASFLMNSTVRVADPPRPDSAGRDADTSGRKAIACSSGQPEAKSGSIAINETSPERRRPDDRGLRIRGLGLRCDDSYHSAADPSSSAHTSGKLAENRYVRFDELRCLVSWLSCIRSDPRADLSLVGLGPVERFGLMKSTRTGLGCGPRCDRGHS